MRLAEAGAKITRNASSRIKGTILTVPTAGSGKFTIEIDCTEVTRNIRDSLGNGIFHSASRHADFLPSRKSDQLPKWNILYFCTRPLAECSFLMYFEGYSTGKFNFSDLHF